jgi:hypothetical protein
VEFTDKTDSLSAISVSLREASGPYRSIVLKSVTVERTELPLTRELAKRLPWADANRVVSVLISTPDQKPFLTTNSTIFIGR